MSRTKEYEIRQGEALIRQLPSGWQEEVRECMQLGSRGVAEHITSILEKEGLLGEFIEQVHVNGTMFSEIVMAFRLSKPVPRADIGKLGILVDSFKLGYLLPFTRFKEVIYGEDMLESLMVLKALDGATRIYPPEQEEVKLQPPQSIQSRN